MNFIDSIQNAGVVGEGGAGFPTYVKLSGKAEYFIVNAAECEPLIETDKYLMRKYASEMIEATTLIGNYIGASKLFIALKGKYKREIEALRAAIAEQNANVSIYEMATFYPAGDEQIIAKLITGKTVPEGGIPLDVSAIINNVGTILSVLRATKENKPITDKYFSITGEVKEAIMVHAPIGTSIVECIDLAERTIDDYVIILGGPMMGRVVKNDADIKAAVVTKTTGNVLILPRDHYLVRLLSTPVKTLKAQGKTACIQCKFCTDMCPRYLSGHNITPHLTMRNLYRAEKMSDEQMRVAFESVYNCSQCGICELFACPMNLSPRRMNMYAKSLLMKRGIQIERTKVSPKERQGFDYVQIPTDRLIARLGLGKYRDMHAEREIQAEPKSVRIPLNQHIGAPAECIVNVGDSVSKGDVIGKAIEGKLSVNIHSSISGVVGKVAGGSVIIER